MKQKFGVLLLGEVWELLDTLDEKTKDKIFYNIDKSKYVNDPELFKKLEEEIWEFRTKYNRKYYRLLAFWDKTEKTETLVVATHGIIKKTDKVPKAEIEKAKAIMKLYFEQKQKKQESWKILIN
jgi:phage-related protein